MSSIAQLLIATLVAIATGPALAQDTFHAVAEGFSPNAFNSSATFTVLVRILQSGDEWFTWEGGLVADVNGEVRGVADATTMLEFGPHEGHSAYMFMVYGDEPDHEIFFTFYPDPMGPGYPAEVDPTPIWTPDANYGDEMQPLVLTVFLPDSTEPLANSTEPMAEPHHHEPSGNFTEPMAEPHHHEPSANFTEPIAEPHHHEPLTNSTEPHHGAESGHDICADIHIGQCDIRAMIGFAGRLLNFGEPDVHDISMYCSCKHVLEHSAASSVTAESTCP